MGAESKYAADIAAAVELSKLVPERTVYVMVNGREARITHSGKRVGELIGLNYHCYMRFKGGDKLEKGR